MLYRAFKLAARVRFYCASLRSWIKQIAYYKRTFFAKGFQLFREMI